MDLNMEKVYDLHQHTRCLTIHIGKKEVSMNILLNASRYFNYPRAEGLKLDTSISYNKQRTIIKGFAGDYEEKREDDIVIDNFRDGLYKLFKKDKKTWDEEDTFLIKAVADYLPLAVKETMKERGIKIENFDPLHYVFIVPSEWEEEIRDDMIRPIFVQSGLLSNQDHQDRLLFYTDIEAIFYQHSFKGEDNTIFCRISPEEEEIIIKFDLIQSTTTLFNIPNTKPFPKVMKSTSVSVPKGDIKRRIKDFLRTKLFPVVTADNNSIRESLNPEVDPSDQGQIIKNIMDGIYSDEFPTMEEEFDEDYDEEEPWIIFNEECMLNESQKKFIGSLCPSIICTEIAIFLLDDMKNVISNSSTRSYNFLLIVDNYSDWVPKFEYGIIWVKNMLWYNSRSLKHASTVITETTSNYILEGARKIASEAIQHSDMYCKPRIVPSADLSISSSVFLNSKPDAIINLDISLSSTLFTCSLLDEDGLSQKIFDHDYFIKDNLPPLRHFYTFSNKTTLNVKEQFFPFAERYLLGDLNDLIADESASIKKDLLLEMKAILINDFSEGKVLKTTDEQKYIKAFMLMYMIYIKEEILYNLPGQLVSDKMNMQIGYVVSIEAMLLKNTVKSKDSLRDIIYASGLVSKDDNSKKLRITTQGEGILPAIQKSLKLELTLRSYFVLCQLHEDYVHLSLHQVVTAPSPEEKEQESIIVQDEMIPIQNIYDSLCSKMWYNLLQDNSLIEPCEMHNTSDSNKVLDLHSSKIKTEFFANLKGYISDNVLQYNPGMRSTGTVNLTSSCSCKVRLTTSDIIDISFTPVLEDIACTLSASLSNMELFGNYLNIDYLFSIIRFNNNPQLQPTFAKILEDEVNDFNSERGIDTSCLVVLELFNQLLQPFIAHQPFCYKDFKVGALEQVCSENYVFSLRTGRYGDPHFLYKSKITDMKTIQYTHKIVFPFLNKWEVINNIRSNRKFYLRNGKVYRLYQFDIAVLRFETMNYLENNETLSLDDNTYQYVDFSGIFFSRIFQGKDVDVPVMSSVKYVSYTSSFQFSVEIFGVDTRDKYLRTVTEIGEPLTLARF